MPGFISDSALARELIRIGDEAIATEDDAKLRAYFRDDYVFHGPGGALSFAGLSAYFASLRQASATSDSYASRSSSTATSWRRGLNSPAISPASSPTPPSDPLSQPASTSNGKSSAHSGTTAVVAWPRSGCRPITAAS
jgi:hypothetical protein